jgi:DNA-binding MarR family transcriptional regulator
VNEERKAELNRILVLFYFSYRTFTDQADKILVKYSLQRMHHRILFFVGHFPGLTVHELLTVLEVSKQALHKPLKRLTELNLVMSATAPHDRRIRQLTLTEQGRALEQELSDSQRMLLEEIFAETGFSKEDAWMEIMTELSQRRPAFDMLRDLE